MPDFQFFLHEFGEKLCLTAGKFHVFWVSALARWKTFQESAELPVATEITVKTGKTAIYKITTTGKLIYAALEAVEKENPELQPPAISAFPQTISPQTN